MGFLAPSTSTNFNRSKMKRADGAPGAATAAQKKPRNDDDEPDFDFEDFDEAEVDMYLAGSVDAAVSGFTVPEHSKQRWLRPSPPPIDSAVHDISMQQIEIDYYIGEGRQDLPGAQEGAAAILRIYGVTQDGNSCMVHVHQYEPYFFIQAPQGFTEADAPAFAEQLNQITDGQDKSKSKPARYIRRVELCQKQTLMGYTQDKVPFIKIVTTWPSNVPTCKGVLERGVSLGRFGHRTYLTYESNILFVMRFMVDTDMVGGNWITAPASKYLLRKTPTSHCQIEIDMLWNDIVSHAPEGEWSKLAPLRILSFDIECAGRKGHFPDAQHDPVIQIANHLTVQGDDSPRVRNILVLGSCAPIVGAEVHSFEDEKKLLEQWRDFVVAVDPDVITGYNIINFDLPYLLNRSEHLGVKKFGYLGRLMGSKSRMKDTVFSSKAYGTRESVETNIDGRVQFDVYQAVQRDHKLHSYSLNSVSAKFLGEQKEDVHHSIISDLHNGDSESRRRLAVYCLKDAYLPQRLLQKLMFMYNYVEMARVTGVPMSFLLSRGQQVKVLSQLLRKAKVRGMVIPNLPRQPAADEQYEGATVLEPRRGFYKEPIATLDFASLYPSIMMAYNLCYCTLLDKNALRSGALQFDPSTMTRTPIGEVFMKPSVRTGLLPEILEELLAARKRAKADLKNATDPMQKAVLDGRQLALKISANSVYGFTGATVGKLPCLEISASVTAFGREMIEKTKNRVESHYSIANGFEHNAVVVYGDTDSVMVKFGSSDIHAVMKMGLEAAGIVTGEFIRPIKLEFEKVYWPYLLINKKRYAGLYWTNPDNYDKMDTKGIETVRRDNCSLVRDVIDTVLHKILIDRSVEQAVEFVKNTISDLLQNRLDISQLVITKALSRAAEEYDSKQAHVELAERMKKRDPATAPAIGDRVPYVMIKGAKGAKGFEKSEDPIYVLENNVPIDTQFYLEHQLSQPLLRIFEPIMENPQSLLSGDHTRTIAVATPSVGGLMKFAVKSLTCLGCKTPLAQGEISVCKHCKHRESDLCAKAVFNLREKQEQFNRLWSQCQRCQGSLHQEVLCSSKDCPIFYRRKKAQKDVADSQVSVDRFAALSF